MFESIVFWGSVWFGLTVVASFVGAKLAIERHFSRGRPSPGPERE
ncbi:hypothetical protein [Haladaptatus sp. NG-WS-4]